MYQVDKAHSYLSSHSILPAVPAHNQRASLSVINGNAQECSRAFPHASLLAQVFQLLIQCSLHSTMGLRTICTSLQKDTHLERVETMANLSFGSSTCVITLEIMNAKQECQMVFNAVQYHMRLSGSPQQKVYFNASHCQGLSYLFS